VLFPAQAPLDAEINHFLACIRDGSTPVADFRFGRDVLKALANIPLAEVSATDLPEGLVDSRFLPCAIRAVP
jgi:predicted dehydrogenase